LKRKAGVLGVVEVKPSITPEESMMTVPGGQSGGSFLPYTVPEADAAGPNQPWKKENGISGQ
jgi:hypothetical protein